MRMKLKAVLLVGLLVTPVFADDITPANLQLSHSFTLGQPGTGGTDVAGDPYANVTNFTGSAILNGGAALQAANGITRLIADDIVPLAVPPATSVTRFDFCIANADVAAVTARPRVRFWFDSANMPGAYYNGASPPANVGFSFNAIAFAPGVSCFFATLPPNTFHMPTSTFWAGVTFDNNNGATGATLAQLNMLGMGTFNPPTEGTSADQIFRTTAEGSFFGINNPAGALENMAGNPVYNLGWRFVPEPATLALMGIAALFVRRRRS